MNMEIFTFILCWVNENAFMHFDFRSRFLYRVVHRFLHSSLRLFIFLFPHLWPLKIQCGFFLRQKFGRFFSLFEDSRWLRVLASGGEVFFFFEYLFHFTNMTQVKRFHSASLKLWNFGSFWNLVEFWIVIKFVEFLVLLKYCRILGHLEFVEFWVFMKFRGFFFG